MFNILLLISIVLIIPSQIRPHCDADIDYDTLQNFVKSLSNEDMILYESLKAEKGLSETLLFLNSPSYQLFKLCQKNDADPNFVCQKTLELLNQGADPNFCCNNLSLIRLASINGQEDVVKILLERGSIPTQDDIAAISIKLNILATCQEDEYLQQDDSYPGVSFAYDKQKLLSIESRLKECLDTKS